MKRICLLFLAVFMEFSLFAFDGMNFSEAEREFENFPDRERPDFPRKKAPPPPRNDFFPDYPPPLPPPPPPPHSPHTKNFRGQRIVVSDKKPDVLRSIVERKDDGFVSVALHFNQPVKSESLVNENILIDGEMLSKNVKIFFSRRVDSIYFEFYGSQSDVLELKNLEGLNGKISESIKVKL